MARRRTSAALVPASRYPNLSLEERFAREMGYQGSSRDMRVSRDASRDPVVAALRDMQRDEGGRGSGVDWPRAFVGAGALAVGAWFIWRTFLAPKEANAAPPGGTIDPTPGVVPAPVGLKVEPNDHVLVKGDFLRGSFPGATFGGQALVRMLVTAVSEAGVVAVLDDPRFGGIASGMPIVVPRSEIDSVIKAGSSPTPPPAPQGIVFLDGGVIPVENGKRYRARLELSTFEAMAANEQLVAAQFASLGFENVQAFHHASDLPGDWPKETTGGDLSKAWFVQGDWRKPDASFPRPPQLARAWKG